MKCWVAWKAFSTALPNRVVASGSWFGEHSKSTPHGPSPKKPGLRLRAAVTLFLGGWRVHLGTHKWPGTRPLFLMIVQSLEHAQLKQLPHQVVAQAETQAHFHGASKARLQKSA